MKFGNDHLHFPRAGRGVELYPHSELFTVAKPYAVIPTVGMRFRLLKVRVHGDATGNSARATLNLFSISASHCCQAPRRGKAGLRCRFLKAGHFRKLGLLPPENIGDHIRRPPGETIEVTPTRNRLVARVQRGNVFDGLFALEEIHAVLLFVGAVDDIA